MRIPTRAAHTYESTVERLGALARGIEDVGSERIEVQRGHLEIWESEGRFELFLGAGLPLIIMREVTTTHHVINNSRPLNSLPGLAPRTR